MSFLAMTGPHPLRAAARMIADQREVDARTINSPGRRQSRAVV
jgi:hypothetical protein